VAAPFRRHCVDSNNADRFRQGDTVVVQGAGPVGRAATLLATHFPVPARLSSSTLSIAGLRRQKTLGATATISMRNTTPEQRRQMTWTATGLHVPNVVMRPPALWTLFPRAELTGNHGRYIVLGLWGAIGTRAISPRDLTLKNMRIGGATFPKPRNYHDAVHLAARVQDRYHA